MTDQVKADGHNQQSGGKKRKRKRNKSKKSENVEVKEPVVEQEVFEDNVHRQNKKFKFNDDGEQENGEVVEDQGEVVEDEIQEYEEPERQQELIPVSDEKEPEEDGDELGEIIPKRTITKHKKQRVVKYNDPEDEDDEDETNTFNFKRSSSQLAATAKQLLEIRQQLPIYHHKDKIVEYINTNQVTIVIGETGSGKSTQIPQFLIPENKGTIAVTQPRRVAAASLAARVSEEYGCRLGQDVGYQVRFTNMSNKWTKLKYLTDGMLLRELMIDPQLKKYSTIILDEAHERTILTDLIMGFLKQLITLGKRNDLKIVVMSATLNAELFSKFFEHAPILYIEGKMYPVLQFYLESDSGRHCGYDDQKYHSSDVLCFLPGQEDIDNCVKSLEQLAPQLPKEAPLIVPLPLYAALSPGQQSKIFEKLPKGRRKIILATNIAETSITVSGVKYVIDSGLRKIKVWKHNLGLSTLLTTPISQASARQRAGRAGRESEGKVFRLYSESTFDTLPKQQESEIKRNDIILPVLTLKKLGVDDLLNWSWLEYPGQDAILSALNTLYTLGALDDAGEVTTLGYKMSVLPLPPQLSVVLVTAAEFGVLAPVIDIVSCLSVDNLISNVTGEARDEINFKRRQHCPLGNTYGDLIALTSKEWCKEMAFSYKGFRNVEKIKRQLQEYMLTTVKQDDSLTSTQKEKQLIKLRAQMDDEDEDNKTLDIPSVLKSFLKGYITNTAVGMPDRSFRTFNTGQLISIHPSSTLFGKPNMDAIMYIEYVFTTKGYARNVSAIELSWLQEVAPHVMGQAKINVNDA
ncbi:putative ATP-dependent RNA helicase DHR2 [Candida viswanathii]|uniref:RNA helicase n=1 Tax=Candida viswanathii TaxID=5486 RepID=A0A367XXW6_9ASCO|nr:putative ATP-dependent RNA helicase DHR2 [Candida viswanathii]